ncbi:hypothetical protein AC44_4900 [Escherichia coli 2-177-06_S3_C3]|nr:hypothetical protein AC44_4900 [Escherichia coli 2-177-06_S3_C3]
MFYQFWIIITIKITEKTLRKRIVKNDNCLNCLTIPTSMH